MISNRLPKYWVVKGDGSKLFKETVIKYAHENIIGSRYWNGNSKSYYGYDGNSNYALRGAYCDSFLSSFENNPTELTITQFIRLITISTNTYGVY